MTIDFLKSPSREKPSFFTKTLLCFLVTARPATVQREAAGAEGPSPASLLPTAARRLPSTPDGEALRPGTSLPRRSVEKGAREGGGREKRRPADKKAN